MSKFIKLSTVHGGPIFVAVDNIVFIESMGAERKAYQDGNRSIVSLTAGGPPDCRLFVTETPEQILALIEGVDASQSHMEEMPYIVAVNDDGYRLIGPFEDELQAVDWAEQKISDPRWNTVYLKTPYQMPEIMHPFR